MGEKRKEGKIHTLQIFVRKKKIFFLKSCILIKDPRKGFVGMALGLSSPKVNVLAG